MALHPATNVVGGIRKVVWPNLLLLLLFVVLNNSVGIICSDVAVQRHRYRNVIVGLIDTMYVRCHVLLG